MRDRVLCRPCCNQIFIRLSLIRNTGLVWHQNFDTSTCWWASETAKALKTVSCFDFDFELLKKELCQPDNLIWQIDWEYFYPHSIFNGHIGWTRVVDPKWFVSDPSPDPTFMDVSAPDPDPDSDPATLVFTSRKLRGNYTYVFVI